MKALSALRKYFCLDIKVHNLAAIPGHVFRVLSWQLWPSTWLNIALFDYAFFPRPKIEEFPLYIQ